MIFHNDIRSYGKDFERFYQRAEKLPGVDFHPQLRLGRPAKIPVTKNVTIRYATTDGGVKEEEFELVVLSVGLNPPAGREGAGAEVRRRARTRTGFCKTNPVNPIETTRPGVFISGAFQRPDGHSRSR